MKRKRCAWIMTGLLMLGTVSAAFAAGNGVRYKPIKPTPTPAITVYGHIDVRAAGQVTFVTNTIDPATEQTVQTTQTVNVDITNVQVTCDGTKISMSKLKRSESSAYPFEYQSIKRNMEVPSTASIVVTCAFRTTVDGVTEETTGSFTFRPADTNCQGTPKGIDLTVTAEKIRAVVIPTFTPTPVPDGTPTPVPDDTPTPVPDDTPTPVPDDTPTPVPDGTPTPVPDDTPTLVPDGTPTPISADAPTPVWSNTPAPQTTLDDVPQTGDGSELVTAFAVGIGVLCIAGLALLYVLKVHKKN